MPCPAALALGQAAHHHHHPIFIAATCTPRDWSCFLFAAKAATSKLRHFACTRPVTSTGARVHCLSSHLRVIPRVPLPCPTTLLLLLPRLVSSRLVPSIHPDFTCRPFLLSWYSSTLSFFLFPRHQFRLHLHLSAFSPAASFALLCFACDASCLICKTRCDASAAPSCTMSRPSRDSRSMSCRARWETWELCYRS